MKESIRRKLKEGKEVCYGTWITLGDPDVVDILRNFSFDWLVLDTEHATLSWETAKKMLQTVGEQGPSTIVRLGQADQYMVKVALDIGSDGVIAPLVNSPEEAERLVNYAMYPPVGTRGTGPARASRYGANLSEYVRRANDEVLVAVQIETTEALSRVKEILSVPRVDMGFVGPSDLTMSLGLVDDRSNPKVIDAMKRVVKVADDLGKTAGTMAANIQEVKKFSEIGFRFISLGSDAKYLTAGARSFLETARR